MSGNSKPINLSNERNQFKTKLMIRIIEAALVTICMLFLIGRPAPKSVEAKTYKISTKKQFQQIPSHRGGTFKLTKDINLGSDYYGFYLNDTDEGAGCTFVIDFNGHQVKGANNITFFIGSKSTKITFKNSKTSSKKINVLNTRSTTSGFDKSVIFELDYGKITIANGIYKASGSNGEVMHLDNGFSDAATVNIKGGTFTASKDYVINSHAGGSLNITGGTFTSGGKTLDNGCALWYYATPSGKIKITKGTFKSTRGKWAIYASPYQWKVKQTNKNFANSLLYKGKYAKSYSLKRNEYGFVIFKSKTVQVKKK